MNRGTWLLLGLGSAVGAILLGRHRLLGSPLAATGTPRVTPHGGFGEPRRGPPAHRHQGIDLVAPAGALVLAVGDGEIVDTKPGLGRIVRKLKLDVSSTWTRGSRPVASVVYADLGEPFVESGDRVRRGDPIARVADAGFFHFAVKEQGDDGDIFFDPSEAGFAYRATGPEVS